MKTVLAQDLFETVQSLSTKIHQASWVNKNKPHVQYPWVVRYMESLMKNLPRTKENFEYLDGELKYLENFLSENG